MDGVTGAALPPKAKGPKVGSPGGKSPSAAMLTFANRLTSSKYSRCNLANEVSSRGKSDDDRVPKSLVIFVTILRDNLPNGLTQHDSRRGLFGRYAHDLLPYNEGMY